MVKNKDGNIELCELNKRQKYYEHWSRNHKDEDINDKDKQKTLFCTWSRYQVVAS